MEDIINIVDEQGIRTGNIGKLEAHQKGTLHEGFSVLIFNSKGELLLQHRATGKYHSGGLWTNTCCGHPRVGEALIDGATRRLREEMGMDEALTEAFDMTYRVDLDNNLIEHEFLHVFFGRSDNDPVINPEEAEGFTWISQQELFADIDERPDKYTYWFKAILNNPEFHWPA